MYIQQSKYFERIHILVQDDIPYMDVIFGKEGDVYTFPGGFKIHH